MAKWSPFTIRDVITKIRDDELVIPVIQRRLVWTEEQMLALFDSLFLQNSFGSIICVEEAAGSKPLFSCRSFTPDGNPTTSVAQDRVPRTRMFVIDGQQRLQSFYIGLWGTYKCKSLFYNLFSNYNELEYDFAFFDVAPKTDGHLWYQASLLFTKLSNHANYTSIADEIINESGITDNASCRSIERNVHAFYERIFKDDCIGISKVDARILNDEIKDRERIAELFQRLNNGGTRLSGYDLVFSSLKGISNDMESFFDILDNRYKSIGMNSGAIIRLMYVLTGNPTKASEDMQDEAKFIADNRKRIEKTLEALKKFLDFSNHTSWFEASGRSVIPLYFLAYYIFYQPCSDDELTYLFDNFDTNNSNFREMSEWLKLSLLNHAFSYGYGWRANTTGMTQIHKIMENYKGKNFPSSQLYLLYSERLRNFINKRRITAKNLASLDEEYLFNMIYGWPKSSKRNEDIDHIHPRSILESAGISPSSIDSIGNLQLLNPDDNRHSKRAKEFGDWLNSEKGPLDKTAYLSMHIIPDEPSLWYSDKFAEFLQKRLEMIAAKIKSSL